jgi:hypothetical protein
MFDEAQDANPLLATILRGQHSIQQIIVGDSCQAIYGWRGAIDAMATRPCDIKATLRQSFRFGPQIAAEANKWLEVLWARYRLAGLPSISSTVGPVSDPQVIMCRTNAEAFVQARAPLKTGRRVALKTATSDLRDLAGAAMDLQSGGRCSHPELATFRTWGQVRDYAALTRPPPISPSAFGSSTPVARLRY